MNVLKALSKQLFGPRYESIGKSLFACFILFFALYFAEIQLAVAPVILYLTATVFTAGIMWQALNAPQNADMMQGIFLLPFENNALTMTYVLAFGGYTLLTKTALVLSMLFAIGNWDVLQIVSALMCAINACFSSASIYALLKQKRRIQAALWFAGIIGTILGVRCAEGVLTLAAVSFGIAVCYLRSVDAYTFYRTTSTRTKTRRFRGKGNVFTYLLRYLLTNKTYMVNTLSLMVVACFLPLLFGQFEGLNALPLGCAILCLNTPICVLLSCDPGLEQAVRVLPGQSARFCSRYCFFIFSVNAIVNCVYLCSWQLQNGGVSELDVIAAMVISLQSAILSVLLEWFRPMRGWKIESDLWHHPRKYIVPGLMLLLGAAISALPPVLWVALGALVVECVGLLIITRRI